MSSLRRPIVALTGAAVLLFGSTALWAAVPAAAATKPAVTSVSPATGRTAGGATVTVSGTGFRHVTKVLFGTTPGKSIKVDSRTKLTVHSPKHAPGSVNIRVETKSGTSPKTSKDHYAFAPTWVPTRTPIPGSASPVPASRLDAVACPVAGTCMAVGDYLKKGHGAGQLARLSHGTWHSSAAPVPSNAAAHPEVLLNAVACPAVGKCFAVGHYNDKSTDTTGLIETLVNDEWTPTRAGLPADSQTPQHADLLSVTCPAVGSCVAIGYYTDGGAQQQGLIETLSNGIWKHTEAPLPANADADEQTVNLTAVTCPANGSCIAAGQYIYLDTGDTAFGGVIETLHGGGWKATKAPLPAGHAQFPTVALISVACGASGSCVAVGQYPNITGDEALIDTLSHGKWTASKAPLPVTIPPGEDPEASLRSVACPTSGSCTAVGNFLKGNDGDTAPLLDTLSRGKWTSSRVAVPAISGGSMFAGLDQVACAGVGACAAAGSFSDSFPRLHALLATLSSGRWTVVEAPVPAGATIKTSTSTIYALACPKLDACTAVGQYSPHGSNFFGFVDTQE
jgi:hypothetical protein